MQAIDNGATVVQDEKPLGIFTRKLNPAQKNYTVGERELLGLQRCIEERTLVQLVVRYYRYR